MVSFNKTHLELFKMDQLTAFYYAIVQTLLRYRIIGWRRLCKSNFKALSTIRNTILQIMMKYNFRYPTTFFN